MDLYEKYRLTRVVNACGKMTHLAGAAVLPEIAAQVEAALPRFFDLDELHACAGEVIAQATGAEWGCVTACTAAGLTLSVAATMTGMDLGNVAQLPDTTDMKNRVVLQKGHAVNFGAPLTQAIRLAGARVIEIGTVNKAETFQLESAIDDQTAAVMFVVSHHTVRYGCVPLEEVVRIAHKRDIPVIVDGAAQSFLLGEIVAAGVDLAVCSGHKYLSGTTAGIVCGRKDLVDAVLLQNRGIGRPMKVGKEGILGALAALEYRMRLDVQAWEAEQMRKVKFVLDQLLEIEGVKVSVEPDPNGNPFSRVRLDVDSEVVGLSARTLAQAMADGEPSIRLRAHHCDEGYVVVDSIELTDKEVALTCERLQSLLSSTAEEKAALTKRYGDSSLSPRFNWLRDADADVRRVTGV